MAGPFGPCPLKDQQMRVAAAKINRNGMNSDRLETGKAADEWLMQA
jgi:hypothetical protein